MISPDSTSADTGYGGPGALTEAIQEASHPTLRLPPHVGKGIGPAPSQSTHDAMLLCPNPAIHL